MGTIVMIKIGIHLFLNNHLAFTQYNGKTDLSVLTYLQLNKFSISSALINSMLTLHHYSWTEIIRAFM